MAWHQRNVRVFDIDMDSAFLYQEISWWHTFSSVYSEDLRKENGTPFQKIWVDISVGY
jgi:hypothetical protein